MSESKTKTNNVSVLAEVALFVQVQTGGEPSEIKDINIDELTEANILEDVVDAVNDSDEVMYAMAMLYRAARAHKEKYPNTRLFISPCFALKEPEEIE